jgi:hypothetical protein
MIYNKKIWKTLNYNKKNLIDHSASFRKCFETESGTLINSNFK